MIKVAIVGNIASGKSTVENILVKKGFPVLDTDNVCHDLLIELAEVKEAFALYDVFEDGIISRNKLGKLVFNDLGLKKRLEDILYPYVRVKIANFFIQNISARYVFVSIPLLFEANMEDLFDKILFIYCDDSLRLERLIKRSGYSKDYAMLRVNSQQPQEKKVEKSDWVVYNNSTLESLEDNISKLIV